MKRVLQRILQDFLKKDNTWNIRCLVDDSFVPSAQEISVLYSRLTNFRPVIWHFMLESKFKKNLRIWDEATFMAFRNALSMFFLGNIYEPIRTIMEGIAERYTFFKVKSAHLKTIQIWIQFSFNKKLRNCAYFFTCILHDYVADDIIKYFWKNNHFENMTAVFLLRCQNSLRQEISLILL
jgi:hypothetical protein